MIILIIGLSGSGKTELTNELAPRINAIVLNGDEVRETLSSDLSFSHEDRIEHARRMGCVARILSSQGYIVIADFICPTSKTRESFGKADFIVWVNRINECQYEDTNKLWEDPIFDIEISDGMTPKEEADAVINCLGLYDWSAPTSLMLGRYQPWHEGHQALYDTVSLDLNQVVIGVRNTYKTSEKDPLKYSEVSGYIKEYIEKPFIIKMPNITRIVYGRDVGYSIDKIDLSPEIESISATQKRKDLGIV